MEVLLEQLTFYIEQYGIYLIIILGILHPFIGFPPHIFILTASLTVLGIPIGYLTLLIGNVIGLVIFYPLISSFRKAKSKKTETKTLIDKTFQWVKTEKSWKHAIVIGAPLLPTHPIKYMISLSGMSYKKFLSITIPAYLILFISNSLLYFGVTSFITETIPKQVGIVLIIMFILFVYFGKHIFNKSNFDENKEFETT